VHSIKTHRHSQLQFMPTPVLIPKATITMEEATIAAWRKQEGDAVVKDEILFEMETDKVLVEVPAPASGILLRIDIPEGVARLDEAIGWIGHAGEAIPAAGRPADVSPRPAVVPSTSGAPAVLPGATPASPAARRRARELGIDLASVRGTGPGGRITESDVENAGRQS
jgi:pyruvate/2-oxoglutarate dehydrogenase complex dihydrolipoamide acyltransferase (E2) component